MIDERIIEEMAKLDRFEPQSIHVGVYKEAMRLVDDEGSYQSEPIHDYLNDHNVCQRVVDRLDGYELSKYACRLIDIFADQIEEQEHLAASGLRCALKATPRQKCEAILKAKGVWI